MLKKKKDKISIPIWMIIHIIVSSSNESLNQLSVIWLSTKDNVCLSFSINQNLKLYILRTDYKTLCIICFKVFLELYILIWKTF